MNAFLNGSLQSETNALLFQKSNLADFLKTFRLVGMNKPITIENLSLSEKIELMEKLWDDLSSSKDYAPPEWHGEELAKRKKALAEGKIAYTDWNKAKEEIRKEVS